MTKIRRQRDGVATVLRLGIDSKEAGAADKRTPIHSMYRARRGGLIREPRWNKNR